MFNIYWKEDDADLFLAYSVEKLNIRNRHTKFIFGGITGKNPLGDIFSIAYGNLIDKTIPLSNRVYYKVYAKRKKLGNNYCRKADKDEVHST